MGTPRNGEGASGVAGDDSSWRAAGNRCQVNTEFYVLPPLHIHCPAGR